MEKLLAFSILSSEPEDIYGSSMTKVLKKRKTQEEFQQRDESNEIRERRPAKVDKLHKINNICFAPELDGLNCFETLIHQ